MDDRVAQGAAVPIDPAIDGPEAFDRGAAVASLIGTLEDAAVP